MIMGIKPHWQYFWYLLRHKWYVFIECCKSNIPWLGIIHDLSKFSSSEWGPYAKWFYGKREILTVWTRFKRGDLIRIGTDKTVVVMSCSVCADHYEVAVLPIAAKQAFDIAWLHHQRRNKHHWKYWILVQDEEEDKALSMPDRYRREMLADLRGTGRVKTGADDTVEWYAKNKEKMQLHPDTRRWIEEQLKEMRQC